MPEDISGERAQMLRVAAMQGPKSTIQSLRDAAQQGSKRSIIDFLQAHQEGFGDLPFGSIDSLILSSLVYLELAKYDLESVTGDQRVPVVDILRFMPTEALACNGWIAKTEQLPDFLMAVARSRRYRDLTVSNFASHYSYKQDTQFAAATFHVAGIDYVAFRGTDGSIAGWNEDFNMAYLPVTPGQTDAFDYLQAAIDRSVGRKLYVGGHSKGGNLAEYATLMLDAERFARVSGVFNHDGPGFLHAPSPRANDPAYRGLLRKTVPGFSVVGMLMEDHDDFQVVKSDGVAMGQHEPLRWQVSGDDFLRLDEVNASARLISTVLFDWLSDLDPAHRELVIETVFDMLEAEDDESFAQLASSVPHTAMMLVREAGKLDEETQDALKRALRNLGGTVATGTKQQMTELLESLRESLPRMGEGRRKADAAEETEE